MFSRRTSGVRLGLTRIRRVFAELSGEYKAWLSTVEVVQVVGTNGKGSTSAMLEAGLLSRGRRVGLFTSPHLHRVGERIRLGGCAVSDEVVRCKYEQVQRAERHVEERCTFFEVLTLIALECFAEARPEVVILEAGLGGRLDSTRVLPPQYVLVTKIGLDHQFYLGDTIEAIAAEKAAVIERGCQAMSVSGQSAAARDVLFARSAEVGVSMQWTDSLDRSPPGLPGPHQRENAGLALAALRHFYPEASAAALDGVCWPGRIEVLRSMPPGVPAGSGVVCFDVAHNEDGIRALCAALQAGDWDVVIFGCMVDKRPEDLVALLRAWLDPRAALWLTPPRDEAGMDAHRLAESGDRVFEPRSSQLVAAFSEALVAGRRVLVCGSHFLVSDLRSSVLNVRAEHPDSPELSDPVGRRR